MADVPIKTETIQLDAFLKWAGAVQTGGEAKRLIQQGQIQVNGRPERRRSYKLAPGDTVTMPDGRKMIVRRSE